MVAEHIFLIVNNTVHISLDLFGEGQNFALGLLIVPELSGGAVDSRNDHRIAMSAAIAATACREDVIILGAQCVEKSYPRFFEEYRKLGGRYEQYLR
mgnify:CR=1 FL=1